MAIQMELYELKNLCMEMASLGAPITKSFLIFTLGKLAEVQKMVVLSAHNPEGYAAFS